MIGWRQMTPISQSLLRSSNTTGSIAQKIFSELKIWNRCSLSCCYVELHNKYDITYSIAYSKWFNMLLWTNLREVCKEQPLILGKRRVIQSLLWIYSPLYKPRICKQWSPYNGAVSNNLNEQPIHDWVTRFLWRLLDIWILSDYFWREWKCCFQELFDRLIARNLHLFAVLWYFQKW